MSKSPNARWVQRWHRRIGIFSALVLLLLSATGFLLNHSSDFNLSQKKLSRAQASWFYADQEAPGFGSYLPQGWVYQLENNILLNGQTIQSCVSPFVGALWIENILYIACEQELHALDNTLRLIESLDTRLAYPAPVRRVSPCEGLCLESGGNSWRYDFNSGAFSETEGVKTWNTLKKLPDDISAKAPSAFSWEKLILDIHAGRFLGPAGIWFMDFFVLVFFVLSFTGIYLWWRKNTSSRNKKSQ